MSGHRTGAARYFQAYTNLHRMPVEGGAPEALTFHDAVIQTDPAPSPDGRTLAFWERTGRGTKIHMMDLEHPTWTRLLRPDGGQETRRAVVRGRKARLHERGLALGHGPSGRRLELMERFLAERLAIPELVSDR